MYQLPEVWRKLIYAHFNPRRICVCDYHTAVAEAARRTQKLFERFRPAEEKPSLLFGGLGPPRMEPASRSPTTKAASQCPCRLAHKTCRLRTPSGSRWCLLGQVPRCFHGQRPVLYNLRGWEQSVVPIQEKQSLRWLCIVNGEMRLSGVYGLVGLLALHSLLGRLDAGWRAAGSVGDCIN
mmetsp:Transcript_95047/g.168792  ORF Transcript_95047/g.168792 Transcript_95047/m.168792 type:complete len:180 (-) Transcript_95047:40-579(-)